MKIDAILFDMDGLMLDTEQLCNQAWRDAAIELGTKMDEAVLTGMIGLNHERCLDYLSALPDYAPYLPALPELNREKYLHKLHHGDIPLKPGIVALLDWLAETGIPRAVGTATESPLAKLKLARTGLDRYFDHIVTVCDVKHSKPAPDIYLEAARRLGKAPAQCLVLEDSPLGAQAALAAGMAVIVIPDLAPPPAHIEKQALAVCKDLFEAKALISTLI